MNPFWRIFKYARPYGRSIGLHIFFNLLAILFSLISISLVIPVLGLIFGQTEGVSIKPEYTGELVDYVKDYLYYEIGQRLETVGQSDALLFVCFIVMIAFFLKNLFSYLASYSITPMRNGITRDLRLEIHHKILELPLSYFSDQRKGDIISRMTTDLKELEWSIIMTVDLLFKNPLMVLTSLGILLYMSPQLTLFVLILLPVVSIIVTWIGKSLKRTSTKAQNRMGQLMSQTEESVSGLKVIKAFNAEPLKRSLFSDLVDSYFRLMNRVMRKSDLASPISETLGVAVMSLIIWYGGRLVIADNDFTAEAFIAYILFFYQILAPAKGLSRANTYVQRGNASATRVLEILDAVNPIENPKSDKEDLSFKGFSELLEFKNVSFAYKQAEGEGMVLDNINLKVPKGKMIALVGQSGSGKSTLTNLVPRFYDPLKGSVVLDGTDIRNLRLKTLRAQMGMVTQESILFNESVHYNIALGKPEASREEVIEAAKIANAHNFINEMPGGYDTNIGDGGGKLSGGQRQRLSIARAVLKNPPILLLDEATSALDTESEKLVQDALSKLMANRTSVVVAHRLSTIQSADLIVVMDKGRIAEQGTHQELMDAQGIYKKLVDLQRF
jgi:subfamily B ATP-binding cassette protein MsbA